MRYQELMDEIERYEQKYEWEERVASWSYLKTIGKLRDVQRNLRILGNMHLRIIKPFLICWGKMKRVLVKASARNWDALVETLRGLEDGFQKLRGKKLLNIDFNDRNIIIDIYEISSFVPYLRGPACLSKIIHLLNPEVFVMWDKGIRERYFVRGTPEGYIKFLKEMKRQLEEAFNDRQSKTGKSWDEIERELRNRYDNKTLAKLVDEYNWIKGGRQYRRPPSECYTL